MIECNIDKVTLNRLKNKATLMLDGWCYSDNTEITGIICKAGTRDFQQITLNPRQDVHNALGLSSKIRVIGFSFFIQEDYSLFDNEIQIEIYAGIECRKTEISQKTLVNNTAENSVIACVENVSFDSVSGTAVITGWALSLLGSKVDFHLVDHYGNEQCIAKRNMLRKDIAEKYHLDQCDSLCGFMITFKPDLEETYALDIGDSAGILQLPVRIEKPNTPAHQSKFSRIRKYLNVYNVKIALEYLKENGILQTIRRVSTGVVPTRQINYHIWFANHRVTQLELEHQKNTVFAYQPKISLLVPTYNTPEKYLREMIDSIIAQSYGNWQLCIADASDSDSNVRDLLRQYSETDSRIKVKYLEKNEGISGNSNQALSLATGEYAGLYDHDDFLEPDALFEIVKALQEQKYDVLYTDEDKYNTKNDHVEAPHFKPDFSIDLLRSYNYITHLFVAKLELIRSVGGFRSEFDGSQDYDLILRCVEKATGIYHLPKVLYHWRMHSESTAANPKNKMYCYEAGKHAIEEHLKRSSIQGNVQIMGEPNWGCYKTTYHMVNEPKVSILIPNYENKTVLERCLNSLFHVNAYSNIEVIIIENNSTSDEIFNYYHQLQKDHDNVRVVRWNGTGFNYSALNNFGAEYATGEYLLLLNNDTEMILPSSLYEMVGYCQREDVGVVGAKLLFPNDTVQHAGVVIGFGSVAGHVFYGINRKSDGYFNRAVVPGNWSAVTGACLMTKKSLYQQSGGLDESLAVAFNDIDYCLKIRSMNKLVVLNPFSLWYHYESVSRGYENDFNKIKRFESEVSIFQNRWSDILLQGDPYYNSNFDVGYTPFQLR